MHGQSDEVQVCRSKAQGCGDEGFYGGGMMFNWGKNQEVHGFLFF